MSTTFPCISLIDTDSIRSVFSLAGGEKISFIVYGPIVLIISIFNIGVLVGVKAYRQPPSDILIFTNIFAVLKIVVIYCTMSTSIISQVYNDIYPEDGSAVNFQNFCIGTGFISVMADMAKGLYTLVFCVYYTRKVRNPLKTWTGHNKELHFICMLVVLLVTFAIYLSGKIGLTPYGYCGIEFTQSSAFVNPAVSIAYTLVLILASVLFLRYIRKIETNNNQTKSYLKYYITFIVLFCFNQTILVVCSFIVSSTCTRQTNTGMFSNAKIISNCCAAISPIFILIVVLSNDKNRKIVVVQIFKKIRQKYRRWRISREHRKRRQRMSYGEELMSQRDSVGIELSELRNLEGYISQLKNKTRACLLSTILGCLSIHHLELKNYTELGLQLRTSAVQQDRQILFQWNFTEKSGFSLTNSIKQHYKHIFIAHLQTVKVYFTAYTPNVLNQFLEMDGIQGVGQTLAPSYNTQQILNDSLNGDQGGGRSGQFFFFNRDRSLILKTLSKTERQVFIERVQLFYEHYRTHPNSLIVKFYSVFTVDLVDLQEHFDFILMGNILKKIDRKYVLRTYDLKGSSHSRQVLKSDTVIQAQISKTMKDIDFQRLQCKIWVSVQDRISLWQRIQADSRFLMGQGLIDYSLIVIKIDLKTLQDQNSDYKFLLQGVSYYLSIKEEGVAYLLGIIDYLQTWNLRKKGEKWYKSIFTKTEKISSQDPGFYSDRFIAFCQDILTTK